MSVHKPQRKYGWWGQTAGFAIGDRVRHYQIDTLEGLIVGRLSDEEVKLRNLVLAKGEIIWIVDFCDGGTGSHQAGYTLRPA